MDASGEQDYIPLGDAEQAKDTPHKFPDKSPRVNRKARLIVRNIPYKINEIQLKSFFVKYGEVLEVCILKRADGNLVGCAFVQYKTVEEAAKAVKKANGQEMMGRKLRVEFSMSKQDYATKKGAITETPAIKTEVKKEEADAEESKPVKKRKMANDAEDGHTVFVKNLNFDTTDEEFAETMKQFGPHHYALITRERISGHSKGTGFVRFKTKESADLCLQNSGKITLKDFTLEMLPAMLRDEAKKIQAKEKEKQPKDSRNLYLMKEGVVLAGSPAAEDVSAADMQKRLYMERSKSQMLKNLNRFLARDRLTIHNLPEGLTDAQLRKVVMKHTNLNPKECRIMRENKPSMGAPLGRSKGFGFLSFATHDEALKTLRKLNNNPSVFSKNSRPIVSFSIEDKKAINLKQKRQEKSKLANPTYQAKLDREKNKSKPGQFVLINNNGHHSTSKKSKKQAIAEESEQGFSGITAKEGVTRFRSKSKLNAQAEKHMKNTKVRQKEAKKKKLQKEIQKDKAEMRVKIPKNKKKVQTNDNFAEIYSNYKKLFSNSTTAKIKKKTKWYE